MSARPEPYRLEAQIGHLLRRAHQRHVAIFLSEMGEEGPTPTQFAALVKLADSKELSQNHLGRLTGMDPATTKGVVSRLIERGLVERAADPTDQRRVRLRLSGEGRCFVSGLLDRARAATAATLAPLSPGEQRRLISLLEKII
ncbi:MAG: MarR family transcriptional regulator [Hyphomicrobiales bacterium]|nr:MarR family transcriptional regulator [Hyphomicrobiales bacterium]MBV9521000.1 MarR family transcriptional regulator [Hyphomicrobiales bacterium]